MASLHVASLFTNLLLNGTINICIDLLFKEGNVVPGLNKRHIFEMLLITLKISFILFNNKNCSQGGEMVMGSPWSNLSWLTIFHETILLKSCPNKLSRKCYKRLVDDNIVLLSVNYYCKALHVICLCHSWFRLYLKILIINVQRHSWNAVKHLRWSFFAKKNKKLLTEDLFERNYDK